MARTLARFYMWKRISSERHPSLGLVTFTAAHNAPKEKSSEKRILRDGGKVGPFQNNGA